MKKICLEMNIINEDGDMDKDKEKKEDKVPNFNNKTIFNNYNDDNNVNMNKYPNKENKDNKDNNNNYSTFDRPIGEISLEINNKKFGESIPENVDYFQKGGLSNTFVF